MSIKQEGVKCISLLIFLKSALTLKLEGVKPSIEFWISVLKSNVGGKYIQ